LNVFAQTDQNATEVRRAAKLTKAAICFPLATQRIIPELRIRQKLKAGWQYQGDNWPISRITPYALQVRSYIFFQLDFYQEAGLRLRR